MPEILIFLAGSAGLAYVSRASLRVPGSHGFYRFLAWESLLALFLVNVRGWFEQPFSAHQLLSWALLFLSLAPLVLGLGTLRRVGKTGRREDGASLLGWEKTTVLVTVGIYHYIRHPMYASLLLLAWGIFFKDPSWMGGVLVLITTFFLFMTARREEVENIRYFGEAYRAYMKHTKMFVPFIV